MFLRKLTVMVVPLALMAALCLLTPLMDQWGFWSPVVQGAMLGVALALLLPLSGAVKKREPFGGLLWVPALLTVAVIFCQYAATTGANVTILSLLTTNNWTVVTVESAFAGFMTTTCLRTRS